MSGVCSLLLVCILRPEYLLQSPVWDLLACGVHKAFLCLHPLLSAPAIVYECVDVCQSIWQIYRFLKLFQRCQILVMIRLSGSYSSFPGTLPTICDVCTYCG